MSILFPLSRLLFMTHPLVFARLRLVAAGVLAVLVLGPTAAGAAEHSVFAYGDAPFAGSTGLVALNQPVTAAARTPDGAGYWVVSKEGRVGGFGTAGSYGSAAGVDPRVPVVAMAGRPTGRGYWLGTTSGAVHSFGDAPFFGSAANRPLNQPIVGMAATPSGTGYWLVAQDGGVFAFGDARFLGSTGGMVLNQPIVGMAATASGNGYWLVARDGGIFTFGDAPFHGSTGAIRLAKSVVGMAPHPSGGGYWLVAADGGTFGFGNAVFHGSLGGTGLTEPAVGILSTPTGNGYWIVTTGHLAAVADARPPEIRITDGSHVVGPGGLAPGDYRMRSAVAGCHWERVTGLTGDASAVQASVTSDHRQVVTLRAGDTFRATGCGNWTSDLYPVRRSPDDAVGDGVWIVHTDVRPGTWTAPGGANCEWSRVRDFSGETSAIRANDNGPVNPVVVIDPFDRGFSSTSCGTWTRS